ncbi:MAG: TrmH family RNA methyltransferase [Chitinivibrionales bacterium]|nr:TrmH family RNA methyltransferase [Chitinivibrionales bacterium]
MQKKGDIETNYDIRSFDADIPLAEYKSLPKNPIYIVVDNLRSAFNVGSIFRIADILRVQGLFLCGYTAFPPHVKLKKTSLGTIEYVPWKRFERTADAVDFLKKKNIPVWAAETTSISQKYNAVSYPCELGVVFGNEALGVSREVVNMCDAVIEIPTYGFKNSLNVAAACAVIGYKFIECVNSEKGHPGDQR